MVQVFELKMEYVDLGYNLQGLVDNWLEYITAR